MTSTTTASAQRLTGRRALVTGSTSGIGRAIAEAFAREGATVVVSGRNKDGGDAVVTRIRESGGTAHFVRADLAEGATAATELARSASEAAGGPVDVLVNNAAVLMPAQSLTDVDDAIIDAALAVNVKAPALLAAALVPGMVEAGGGVIVNVGSINGSIGSPVAALYGATKAALHSLTQSWAAELAPKGIRVNAIAPGPTMTEENAAFHDMLRTFAAAAPDGRPGTAAEVADAAVFLTGDQSTHIHGITLPVDGGYLIAR
jgi:NAD(P)-dependent dehydrogenase (short-subunit alcohol dehydrogenase family)